MRCFFFAIWFGLCLNLNAAELPSAPFIEVIHSDAYPVTGIQALKRQGMAIKLYNLDDGKRLVSQLATNLPHNQDAAKKTLQQRFKKMGNQAVKGQFIRAYQGVIVGTQYGVTRYPAVIFDHGRAVVYGITDLPQALTLYRQWQATQ
jgi:integrating conjugative element protein (TIGR03757 family)